MGHASEPSQEPTETSLQTGPTVGLRREARWALGVGIAAIAISLLGWPAALFVGGEQRWLLLAALAVPLVLAVLAVVLGIRAHRRIARLHTAGRGSAIVAWVCGLGAIVNAVTQIGAVVAIDVITPGQLATQALSGMAAAQTTHYTGSLDRLGVPYKLDLTANRDGDLRGSVTRIGQTVEILKVGTNVYLRGRGYWDDVTDRVTLQVYGDNWVRTGADPKLAPAFVLAYGELAHDLLDRFKPNGAVATTLGGSPATKLTGPQGDLSVTRSQPVRALRFTGAAAFTSSSGLARLKLDFKYPAALDLGPPQKFVDSRDQATWPARFQVENVKQGACGDTSCAITADVVNQAGSSVGQAVATFSLIDADGHSLGSCTANIPPIEHLKTETVGCTVSSPEWIAFAQRGGSYRENVEIHNPIYND